MNSWQIQCMKLAKQLNKCRRQRRSDIELSISYLGQVYGLMEQGDYDKASDLCRAAAESWTQDIAEIDAFLTPDSAPAAHPAEVPHE